MEDVANNKLVPKEKFKDITLSSKDPIKSMNSSQSIYEYMLSNVTTERL